MCLSVSVIVQVTFVHRAVFIKCSMCLPCCWTTHSSRRRHWPMAWSMKFCDSLPHLVTLHKVVYIETHLRCGGIFCDSILLQSFSWFWQWNNFEDKLISDKIKAYKTIYCANFGATLYTVTRTVKSVNILAYLYTVEHLITNRQDRFLNRFRCQENYVCQTLIM